MHKFALRFFEMSGFFGANLRCDCEVSPQNYAQICVASLRCLGFSGPLRGALFGNDVKKVVLEQEPFSKAWFFFELPRGGVFKNTVFF